MALDRAAVLREQVERPGELVAADADARVIVRDRAAHAPEEPAEREAERHVVEVRPHPQPVAPEEVHGERDADEEAADRRQPLPDVEEADRVGEVLDRLVHQAVADVPADERADDEPADEPVDRVGVVSLAARPRHRQPPAEQEPERDEHAEPVDLELLEREARGERDVEDDARIERNDRRHARPPRRTASRLARDRRPGHRRRDAGAIRR